MSARKTIRGEFNEQVKWQKKENEVLWIDGESTVMLPATMSVHVDLQIAKFSAESNAEEKIVRFALPSAQFNKIVCIFLQS